MKLESIIRVGFTLTVGLLMACSTTKKDVSQVPESDDLLELLTGFGESLSKRNFNMAVEYMVPEEKALMMEGGSVPSDKQKMLTALPLQTLIRNPAIRVQNGRIAGIYSVLPNLRQGEAMSAAPKGIEEADMGSDSGALTSESGGATGYEAFTGSTGSDIEAEPAVAVNQDSAMLKQTVNKFFTAVNKKNWAGALAMMNESERKFLLDEKGKLKESSKQRLSQIDQRNREALVIQDGKLTGVTLLLPSGDL